MTMPPIDYSGAKRFQPSFGSPPVTQAQSVEAPNITPGSVIPAGPATNLDLQHTNVLLERNNVLLAELTETILGLIRVTANLTRERKNNE